MAGTTAPVILGGQTGTRTTICLTGIVRRAEEVGIIQRGTHRLIDLSGNVIAALRSNQVNLFALEGQFVTVCGINEGRIEGVLSIFVTQAFRANVPGTVPPFPGQLDLRTLLLFILFTQPQLLRGIRLDILLALLFGGGLFGLPGAGAGTAFGAQPFGAAQFGAQPFGTL
jgi:hypothetical protein